MFGSLPWAAYKERYFQYLYYLGAQPEHLRAALHAGDPVSTIALFGWGRSSQRLGGGKTPVAEHEIEAEVDSFRAFASALEARGTPDPVLAYAVIPAGAPAPFGNLDRWYERGPAVTIGDQLLFPLQLRTPAERLSPE
jgi:hypothetical protein